jgi:hypothetical protein
VLRGFSELLAAGGVEALQFEYGRANIVTHNLLRDHYELLEPLGYVVGKVYPGSVDFRPYDVWLDEDFLGPNYLAVRAANTALVSALRG